MAKIGIRVEGNSQIGLGHVMRCVALAEALQKTQHEVSFIVSRQTAQLETLKPFEKQLFPTHLLVDDEPDWLAQIMQRDAVQALIMDGYQFTEHYRRAIRQLAVPVILFDDTNSSGPLHADLVINPASNADGLGYQATAPNARLCLGEAYRVLRQEFVQQPVQPLQNRHGLTLVMGGADHANLTLPLLIALQQQQFEGAVTVITGEAYPYLAELQNWLAGSELQLQHIHHCQQMANLFADSRLVISAAGGSQFELLACATPTMLLVVADNQQNASQAASQQGWCEVFDMQMQNKQFACEQVAARAIQLFAQQDKLLQMHQQALAYRDVKGGERVIENIQALLA